MHILILVTCAQKKEAQEIAAFLMRQKLAACVNIVEKIDSVFFWEKKVQRAKEVLLLVKSRRPKLARIIKLVKSRHSYQVPEIIALPIIGGHKPYLDWIDDALG